MCFIDDAWHTFCHKKNLFYKIPYRFNIELGSINMRFKHIFQLKEERNAVFYHLKDISQEFYKINNRNEIKFMQIVRGINEIDVVLNKLFDIKEWVDSEITNLSQK